VQRYLIIIYLTLLSGQTLGQQFFRLKADFSIKENLPDSSQVLTMGTVYFDKNSHQVVYDITFPQKGIYILTDSATYEINPGKPAKKTKTYNLYNFSIYNLALSSNLYNYGLTNNMVFKLTDVEKEDSLVISTWSPSIKKIAELTGDVKISTKNKQLYGLAFFDQHKKLLSKQFFENYTMYKGLAFPGQILQINYIKDKEYYKITTYKNVVINAPNENEKYNYPLPVN
jgi:hypothetical protein